MQQSAVNEPEDIVEYIVALPLWDEVETLRISLGMFAVIDLKRGHVSAAGTRQERDIINKETNHELAGYLDHDVTIWSSRLGIKSGNPVGDLPKR